MKMLSILKMVQGILKKYNSKIILIGIIIFSILTRMAAALLFGDQVTDLPGTFDQISYHNLALRVLGGHGFSFAQKWWPITAAGAPTAHWSFLYTLYLVLVYSIFGPHPILARLIQAILVGILQPILVYIIARRIFGEIVGLVSAGLTAVYAYFIYYAATLMTEPFYITALLASLYLAIIIVDNAKKESFVKKDLLLLGVALGLTLGVAVLLRQLILLIIPFIFLWILWAAKKNAISMILKTLFISGSLIVLMILPFTIYNYARFDRFELLNTNAGFAFFWGNHPIYGTHFISILPSSMGSYQSLIPEELRNLDEAALDQALMKRGLQFIVDDPVRILKLSISRIPVYFMFWPSRGSGTISNIARVGSFGILWPFMLYGLFLAVSSKKYDSSFTSPIFLLILFVVIYSMIHLLSWTLIRYRLPVDAVMLVFSGLALIDLFHRFSEKFQKHRAQSREIGHPTQFTSP